MSTLKKYTSYLFLAFVLASCVDSELAVKPKDEDYPFRLILDTDEGGDLADAEDYGLEISFADFIGDLPSEPITLTYEIEGVGSFDGVVAIDKVVYEVEVDDCVYERELDFDPVAKTITITEDNDLGSLPEAFEVVFLLPGVEDTEGGFTFEITDLQTTNENVIVGEPSQFEYEVLVNELAGEWVWELESEDDLNEFKEVFSSISPELNDLELTDILDDDGRFIRIQFEYGEMKFEIELVEEEEVCVEGEIETENLQLEIEAEWDAEEGELELEGSHLIIGDDAEIENELDFIVSATYVLDELNGTIALTFLKIIDEDNYEEGEELFISEIGSTFTFEKD